MDSTTKTMIKHLSAPILRDLARRCSDTDGGARADDTAQRWAMKGARIDHMFQNPFVDGAALLADLGILGEEENFPYLLVSAAGLEDHFTSPEGASRLQAFADDEGRVFRLIECYAGFANDYWSPSLPLGPEPFGPDITETPALKALKAAGYVEYTDGIWAWSNRFGKMITRHDPGKHGWPVDLNTS